MKAFIIWFNGRSNNGINNIEQQFQVRAPKSLDLHNRFDFSMHAYVKRAELKKRFQNYC